MDNQKIASELVDMAERIARKPSEESLQRLAPKGEKAFFAGLANEIAEDLDSSVALDRSLETHYGGTEITLIKDSNLCSLRHQRISKNTINLW